MWTSTIDVSIESYVMCYGRTKPAAEKGDGYS